MAERYSFAVDRHLVSNLSVNGSVVWSQDNIDNTTLNDTIADGYVTAEDETQYLSVLDATNEISLENLNITLSTTTTAAKLEVDEATTTETFITDEDVVEQTPEDGSEHQQVVVYSVEGSDELFGIQLAQDEEGNVQKYQFQFRKNKDGQLEAIPETIQLLPMDEGEEETNLETLQQQQQEESDAVGVQHAMHIFVQEDNSDEHILPDRNVLGEQSEDENTEEFYGSEHIEEVDIKPGLLALQNLKQEIQEHHHHLHQDSPPVDEEISESYPEEDVSTTDHEEAVEDSTTHDQTLLEFDGHVVDDSSGNCSENQEVCYETDKGHHPEEMDESFEHIEVNPDLDVNTHEENGQELEESDLEDSYHIVEGVHITGDVEAVPSPPPEPVVEKTNILRQALKTNKELLRVRKDNRLFLYVVQHPEKENVAMLCKQQQQQQQPKANPRSILKSSFQARNENETVTQTEPLVGKRFARCKEAVQARIFHNFINKTTIPQAPVRKDRLPRKQEIKPVQRMDEEIVVQEVMVSNNGFVEAVTGGGVNKENLEVMEYVELSDSDDDYDPKRTSSTTRRKKKHKRKKIEITISDDEEDSSEDSVIELGESDEDKEDNGGTPTTKRRRGRPPKNRPPVEDDGSSSKRSKAVPEVGVEELPKPEIPCPKCDKTFPSQNSLKTHLQHHSLQNSLKNATTKLPEYKYKCEPCSMTFKNAILLKRHVCSSISCTVCKKKFPDQPSLTHHKRLHAKEQLLKTTTLPPPSPRRSVLATSSSSSSAGALFKVPKKVASSTLKCKTCGKLCSSLQNLNIHQRSHREYTCATCSTKFLSQLALEKHLRESCVKSPQSVRRSMRLSGSVGGPGGGGGGGWKVGCDRCTMEFPSFQTLFKHKVKDHGVHTPDKGVLEGSKVGRSGRRRVHGGVPVAKVLSDAYLEMKGQLNFDN